jgi:hypothetical protein
LAPSKRRRSADFNCRQLPFAGFELSCDFKTLTAASALPYTGQIPDNLAHLNLKITFL